MHNTKNKATKMKFILIFVCLLLLFYNFESNELLYKNINDRVVVMWKLRNKKILLHIFPHDQHVLIDDKAIYLYLDNTNHDTYVPAIKLIDNVKQFIVNYRYLLEWSDENPKVKRYPKNMDSIIEILNWVRF